MRNIIYQICINTKFNKFIIFLFNNNFQVFRDWEAYKREKDSDNDEYVNLLREKVKEKLLDLNEYVFIIIIF